MKKKIISYGCLLLAILVLNKSLWGNYNKEALTFKVNDVNITINYPITKYKKLNDKIKSLTNKYEKEFPSYLEYMDNDISYELNINYRKSSYKDYISLVFYTSLYLGGAHPSHVIDTINYDIKEDKIIDINYLAENKMVLDTIAKESQKLLLKNDVFKDKDIYNMMIEGTIAKKENFRNFIYTKEGIKFFFERYQVAPYAYGDYTVTIPYSALNIKG